MVPMPARKPLSHVDRRGRIRMVDVGDKPETAREAVASAEIRVSKAALSAVRRGAVKKGDPLQIARIAGIQAAKRTSDMIPLCHPLALSHIDIDIRPRAWGYELRSIVRTAGRTGVEMEALAAVTVAALTIYDMLKAVDRAMTIGQIAVLEKRGGRSGHYLAAGALAQAGRRKTQK
jgi:cyclic pyranopterin monophosphate synthase